jgi:TDG/mug DNA glycosylase family protein
LRSKEGISALPELPIISSSSNKPIHRPLPDYLGPKLRLLFVGINPGLISAAAGHYYTNPRNSFWRLLHESGLTEIRLRPEDDFRLPSFGYGITDIVKRPSGGAADLAFKEFVGGRRRLEQIVQQFRPSAVCFNGKTAFEGYFGKAVCKKFGPQRVLLAGTPVFVLPSTSPANAGVPLGVKLRYFKTLRRWLEKRTANCRSRKQDL